MAASPTATPLLRAVSAANALAMAVGQYWYSVWWEGEARIAAFVQPTATGAHSLHACGQCPSAVLCLVGLHYAAFTLLFSCAAVAEVSDRDVYYIYAVGASAWHAWCGAILLACAFLQWNGCSTPDTPMDRKHEDEHASGSCGASTARRSVIGDGVWRSPPQPLSTTTTRLLQLPLPLPLPLAQPHPGSTSAAPVRSGGRTSTSLFRLEQGSLH